MKAQQIILYSNHCPKCEILKKKLDSKNIAYTLFDNIDEMIKKGFDSMPRLQIENDILDFSTAISWVNNQ